MVCPLRNGPERVLFVLGEADASNAGQLRDNLMAAFAFSPASIVVDLSGLTFCALAGLDALNDVVAAADAFGVPLALRGMSRQLAWLHRTFPARPAVPALSLDPLAAARASTAASVARRSQLRASGERMSHRFVSEKGA